MIPMVAYYNALMGLLEARTPFIQVTLIEAELSVPQHVGAKMLVTTDGLYHGTIGGGRLELSAVTLAKDVLSEKVELPKRIVHWNLKKDLSMTCGGSVSLFFEIFGNHTWTIAVFGSGHVAQALVRLLSSLDCYVICIDSRQEWLDRLPKASNIETRLMESPVEGVAHLPKDAFIISMTLGHAYDLPIVEEVLKQRDPLYLGVIGSQTKATLFKRDLINRGVDQERVRKIFCPIGLKFGTRNPSEIAVSIASQLLMVRDELWGVQREKLGS